LRFIDGELQNGEEVYNVGSDEEQEKEEDEYEKKKKCIYSS